MRPFRLVIVSISLAFWNIPLRCRTRLLSITRAGTLLRYHPDYVTAFLAMEGPWFIPDDAKLHRKLLRWYSSVQTGMAELIPVAKQWQMEEPESEDARYSCVLKGCTAARGKACLPISARTGKVTHLHKLIICCCSGASVIARIISRY